jgi:hypothetical protein
MSGNGAKRSLEEIFEEHLATTKAGFDRMNQGLAEVRSEMAQAFAQVRTEMAQGFAKVDRRFDALLKNTGGHHRDHHTRIKS